MKKRKKHYTTKHTHIHNKKRKLENGYWTPKKTRKEKLYEHIIGWSVIICILIHILLKACNNNIVGYDYFPNIPYEWIEKLR
ncbi:MAG: hypothetical protein E7099_08045 [Mediterranea massiliensis]|nr:hypothetical protein [Mediterranea massiliensis]